MRRISQLLILLTIAPLLIECLECGSVKVQLPVKLVVGGGAVDVAPGKWPWLVPLFRNNAYTCGSTLIDARHLVSAAHCILQNDPQNFFALPGRHNIADDKENNWVNRTIATVFIHADYNDNAEAFKSKADIAIFRMSQTVVFNNYIQPVCLPAANAPSADLQGTVVGYGYHNGRQNEVTPKQALMTSIDYARCLLVNKFYVQIVSGSSFCARSTNAAPCTGDSGGGYFVKDNKTQRYTTFGIISQAISHCDPNDYTAFVDVTKYVGWINEKIKQDFEDPPYDICSISPCGKNARCSIFSGHIKCSCLEGFYGEPPNCTEYQCESHQQCDALQVCSSTGKCVDPCDLNVCGLNALCEPRDGHRYQCLCLRAYESDGRNGCRRKTVTTALPTTLATTTTTLQQTEAKTTTISTTIAPQTTSIASRLAAPDESRQSALCGITKVQPPATDESVTGTRAGVKGQFPWFAAVYHRGAESSGLICGGSLVSTKVVITAATCIQEKRRAAMRKVEETLVYLGKYFLYSRPSEPGSVISRVSQFIVHEDWIPSAESFDADIAAVILAQAVQYSDSVRPICLWTETNTYGDIVGQTGVVAGYGLTENSATASDTPHWVEPPVVSEDTCLRSDAGFIKLLSKRTFCAGTRSGTFNVPCKGDTGNALAVNIKGRWYIRGIASVTLVNAQGKCDQSNYAVFTDTAAFRSWIWQVVSKFG